MKYKASIFIPTSNNINALKPCLKSLQNQSRKDFNIILIGKEKNEDIENLTYVFKTLRIKYLIQKKPGLVTAANEALKKTKSKIFIRIDDDIVADQNWFKNILETFRLNKNIGAVTGPTIINSKNTSSRDLIYYLKKRRNRNLLFKLINIIYHKYLFENKTYEVGKFLRSGVFTIGSNFKQYIPKTIIDVDNLEACNFACKTNILRKIGGFDKVFSKGLGEYHEADVAFKIKSLKLKILFNPKVKVNHEIKNNHTVRPESYYRIQNFIVFYKRYFKIDSFDTLLRFTLYLMVQNLYYSFKFLSTGKIDQLKSIPGTFIGLYKNYVKSQHLYS